MIYSGLITKYLGYMSFTGGPPVIWGMRQMGRFTRFAGFTIVDDEKDSGRLQAEEAQQQQMAISAWQDQRQHDVDATPPVFPAASPTPAPTIFPMNEIVVHGTGDTAREVAELLKSLGLNVAVGSRLPADAPIGFPDLVYVQIGHGVVWEDGSN
jgi:hypothetical protein